MANKVVLLGDNICCYYFNYTGFFPQTNSTSTSALLPYTKYMPSPALLAHNTQPLNLTRPNPSTTLMSKLLLLFPTGFFCSITCKTKKLNYFFCKQIFTTSLMGQQRGHQKMMLLKNLLFLMIPLVSCL